MKKIFFGGATRILYVFLLLIFASSFNDVNAQAQTPNIDNTFIMFDDFSSLDRIVLSKAFYKQHPGDQYDFLYFFYDEDSGSGADFVPVKTSNTFLSSTQSSFDNAKLYGSGGRLLGTVIDHTSLTNLDRGGFMDTLFFGVMQHELFHYWGIYLPQRLSDARCDSAHWVGYIGSRLSCGGDSNNKFIVKDNKYYYYKNCVGIPKFHDFELYSIGLISSEDVKEKVVIYNPEKDFANDFKTYSDCQKVTNVPKEYILNSYSVQDFIDILGPSIMQPKNNFNVAFILVKPLGAVASSNEIYSLNWWASRAPIAWYKSTKGLSTLNSKVPDNRIQPVIFNVKILKDDTQIRVSWETDKPSVSAISLKNTVYGYTNIIYRSKLSPPEYSKSHSFIVNSIDDGNIGYFGTKDFIIEKVISVDEHLNVGTYIPTLDIAVLGEESPHITSISPDSSPADGLLTINGIRFSTKKSNQVTLDNPYSSCPDGYTCTGYRRYDVTSFDGKTLRFIPNIDPGSYTLQVNHPETGQSNRVWIEISSSTMSVKSSVTPNKDKVVSGDTVILNYVVPKGVISSSLMLYCPNGIKALDLKSNNVCNKKIELGQKPNSTTLKLSSTAEWPQYVVPNFYIYYEHDPNFAIGVTSQIAVLPLSKATTTPSATPSATSTGLIGRVVNGVQGVLSSTVKTITSVIKLGPSPSPSITPKVSPLASPSVSPSPSTSVTVTPRASTTVSPNPSPSITPRISPTPISTIRPSASPSPSSTPRPSSTPSPTPVVTPAPSSTPSPTPSPAPTPSATPVSTPTPSPSSTPSSSPSPIPSATPVATPSSSPTPVPTATPAPSNSPTPSPFGYSLKKTRTASTFEAYLRLIGIIR